MTVDQTINYLVKHNMHNFEFIIVMSSFNIQRKPQVINNLNNLLKHDDKAYERDLIIKSFERTKHIKLDDSQLDYLLQSKINDINDGIREWWTQELMLLDITPVDIDLLINVIDKLTDVEHHNYHGHTPTIIKI